MVKYNALLLLVGSFVGLSSLGFVYTPEDDQMIQMDIEIKSSTEINKILPADHRNIKP